MCNVRCWSLEELYVLLQLEGHTLVLDTIDEVDGSGVAFVHSGERVKVVAEYNNLAPLQQLVIFPVDELTRISSDIDCRVILVDW